ncbi:MAG: 2Fe-2S iron-sulfur cluster-binding protein [Gammaproteobacteria bacterium]
MNHEVELAPGGEVFEVAEGETVLDAALRAGIELQYGCRQGRCSTCKYLIEDGEVDFGRASVYSLPDNERDDGWALLCCAKPETDLLIRDNRRHDARTRPLLTPRDTPATVVACTALTAELWELRVALPAPLTFYAGQYAELTLAADGAPVRRSYSMASAPDAGNELAFVLKRIEGGAFSARVTALAPGATLALRGPFGSSYLRDGERPVLLGAIGSGLAPILAMLRDAAAHGDTRRFTFYYGARRPADLPCESELAALGRQLGGLRYVPTLDGLQDDDAWNGAVGNVTQAIQRDVDDAHDLDAYLCGAPEMCETVGRLLLAKGLPEHQLFFDRFFAAS